MNKHYRKVLEALKTSKDIKALGFSRSEVKGIAANVADKLNISEEATDDEVSDAISDAIDNVLPILKLTQSAVDRQVQSYKDAHPANDDDDDDDDDDKPGRRNSPSKSSKTGKKADEDGDSAALTAIKELMETVKGLKGDIDQMKTGKVEDKRLAKVKEMLKDTGKFGERHLKAFKRMKFSDDDEFEDYCEELTESINEENQERANQGLEKLGTPPAPHKSKNEGEELMSDDEVKKLAKM